MKALFDIGEGAIKIAKEYYDNGLLKYVLIGIVVLGVYIFLKI